MSIEDIAAQALAERNAAMRRYAAVPDVEALEALRLQNASEEDKEQANRELAILRRKRTMKGEWEDLSALADFFDKSALPVAAAVPVFLTFLAGEKILVDPLRSKVLVTAYLFGGCAWIFCRWKAFQYGRRAKRGAAELGKVD